MTAEEMSDDDLDGYERYEPSAWFAAIRTADCWRDALLPNGRPAIGDLSPLVKLLRHRLQRTPDGQMVTLARPDCELLIDLLSRHRLQQKPGGRKVPIYKRSRADVRLEWAAEDVHYYRQQGRGLDDAVEQVATQHGIDAGTLRQHMRGQLGFTRRR